MTRFLIAWILAIFGVALAQSDTSAVPSTPMLEGCSLFPNDNIWNVRIDDLPVHPSSGEFVASIGLDQHAHPDFGSGSWEGSPIGIPVTVVEPDQPKFPIQFLYDEESDQGPYPIPDKPLIEGGNDRHVILLEKETCILYELFDVAQGPDGTWRAGSGAIFDLYSQALRPQGWTSADAAGLPILPGLVRYDEVMSGEIRHALRFTAPVTQRAYVWPARHYASEVEDPAYPPMGQRFRLRADYDTSGFAFEARVVADALKRYGMMLADNGSAWFISGVPDERWNNEHLRDLKQITGADFEAVDVSSLMVHPDSGASRDR